MNLKDILLKEKVHTKKQAMAVVHYACRSKAHFEELIACFLSNEYRVAQRAAWSVSWAALEKPEMILPYTEALVRQLQRKNVHPAVVRNSVRVLEKMAIPEKYHGEVMNACFGFIESSETPVAVKVFSLTALYNLSETYPEIKQELALLIEDRIDNESAAFKSRANKILKQLK
ncbi:MAG: hypothetical protein LBE82_10700 [Chitinophagaceae bacterium]|jgi:hypothetical protein|nr:hypothetical protein [Chitinophagaceae bacterium]